MVDTETSSNLLYSQYSPSVEVCPENILYTIHSSEYYGINGYNFTVKSPAYGARLSPEAWIEYDICIYEKTNNAIRNLFITARDNSNDRSFYINNMSHSQWIRNTGATIDANDDRVNSYNFLNQMLGNPVRLAFRSGFLMARATQNLSVTINGCTRNHVPYKCIDILNRMYYSQTQSKHLFSTSGGEFDSGAHNFVISEDNYAQHISKGGASSTKTWDHTPTEDDDYTIRMNNYWNLPNPITQFDISGNTNYIAATIGEQGDEEFKNNAQGICLYHRFPDSPHFYNGGFSNRFYDFATTLRGGLQRGTQNGQVTGAKPNEGYFNASTIYEGSGTIDANRHWYKFKFFEPVPCPPFKMYENDGVVGIIPHVQDLNLVSAFASNMLPLIFQCTDDYSNDIGFRWEEITSTNCKLHLRWYQAPMTVTIPREVSLPLRHYYHYSQSNYTLNVMPDDGSKWNTDWSHIAQYNISLDAVPDYLIIWFRKNISLIKTNDPVEYNFEINNLTIQIENTGGKLTGMQTIHLYKNWLRYIKHNDPVDTTFDEWRKFLCVAVLTPDDYGIKRGPGYDNLVVLGIDMDVRSNHVWPYMNRGYLAGLRQCLASEGELNVLSVFDRWSLTMVDGGAARAALTRLSALRAN
jgi:hypothetical protein